MTEEQIALARRAVACKGWRWVPGMRYGSVDVIDGTASPWSFNGYERVGEHVDMVAYTDWVPCLPDLEDPATLGCLLALVREAWGDQVLTCARVDVLDDYIAPLPGGYPYVVVREGRKKVLRRYFGSEVEALVAALEAAP